MLKTLRKYKYLTNSSLNGSKNIWTKHVHKINLSVMNPLKRCVILKKDLNEESLLSHHHYLEEFFDHESNYYGDCMTVKHNWFDEGRYETAR